MCHICMVFHRYEFVYELFYPAFWKKLMRKFHICRAFRLYEFVYDLLIYASSEIWMGTRCMKAAFLPLYGSFYELLGQRVG